MHGNTRTTADGIKTRNFEEILDEIDQAFDIHAACGNRLGGIHIEVTGEDVTECIGGARGLREADLKLAYKSGLDPTAQLRAGSRNGAVHFAQDEHYRRPRSGHQVNAVAPFALGAVQRFVGGVQQGLGGPFAAVLHHSKTGGHRECARPAMIFQPFPALPQALH